MDNDLSKKVRLYTQRLAEDRTLPCCKLDETGIFVIVRGALESDKRKEITGLFRGKIGRASCRERV